MSTLHVYGDSYCVDHGVDWQWYKQYASKAKLDLRVTADFGVANEWISMRWYQDYKDCVIKEGDVCVVVMTACIRHWFLWDHPNISNYQNMTHLDPDFFGITKDQIRAVEMYYKHIQSGFVDAWKYDANTAWWNHYAKVLKDINCELIIIQGFSNMTDVKQVGTNRSFDSSLFATVCTGEFKSQEAMDAYYERGLPDQRVNHMLKDNHHVLSEALMTGKDVDLTKLPWTLNKLSLNTEQFLKDQISPKLLR